MKNLIIVESPGKIKTIQGFLGNDYIVKASIGHCYKIDDDDNAIDIENNYEPHYILDPKKSTVIKEIKEAAKKCDVCYMASDPDREGEAISWNIAHRAIGKICPIKRIVFHEITKSAIIKAIENPIELNEDLFHAQQARSVLDRIVGYKVSKVLWKKVCSKTSAGRVQSVALRFIVDKQKEIDAFKPEEYWSIAGSFSDDIGNTFKAEHKIEKKITNKTDADSAVAEIQKEKNWKIDDIKTSSTKKSPTAPFTTSTLQQFGSSHFGWNGKVTMSYAQSLYEGFAIKGHGSVGLISYHRTDSTNISEEAINSSRDLIKKYGKKYLPDQPIVYKSKNKSAQEAHEGIRPSHLEINLQLIKDSIPENEFKLYRAIYCKFVSCQMTSAEIDATRISILSGEKQFTTGGQVIKFDGFLKVWDYSDIKNEELPPLKAGQKLKLISVTPEQHFTKPPAMFNDGSLTKTLEENGVGRPATYAAIPDTILKRLYVTREGKAFKPTELGTSISDYLVVHFPELMNVEYTANMEENLDKVADGEVVWHKMVDGFYKELKIRIDEALKEDGVKKSEVTDILCPTCKKNNLVKRRSRTGWFYGCDGYIKKGADKCKAMFQIGENGEPVLKVRKYLEVDGKKVKCEKCGKDIVIRTAKKTGKEFGGCSNFPRCREMYNLDGSHIVFKSKYSKKEKE